MYPQIFGKYVLERELSRGGMARVVLATLRGAGGFEKKLVVKQIRDELAFDQQFVRRFVEEAKTTVALSHPNIVPVYELGVEQGTYFLAMELVEGVSVAELLRERNEDGTRRVLSPEEGAYVGVEVCRALDYAHRRMKVVHRDITPRNVMIDVEGLVKLIDFGIAAPARVSGQEILGSPGHMAPEQVDGGELGPPTDIFAIAVLLMEAWTGSPPFRRATPEECAAAVRERHPKPSEFDARLRPLDDAIARAMSVDPKRRQQKASELARELRAFLKGVDVADVARALGDRVHQLREQQAASVEPPSRNSAPRPSAPSHGDLGTKTFAARDEALGSWSGVPASRRVVPDAYEDDEIVPSTRQMPESTPHVPSSTPRPSAPVVEAPARPIPAIRANRGRRDDPAMAIPTPLMVDVDELEKIHADIKERQSESQLATTSTPTTSTPTTSTPTVATPTSETPVAATPKKSTAAAAAKQDDIPTMRRRRIEHDPRPAEKVETIATRPFETPVGSPESARGAGTGSAKGPSRPTLWQALAAVAIVVVGFAAWRVGAAGANAQRPTVATATATSVAAPTSSSAASSTVVTPSASAASGPDRPALGVGTTAPVASSASSSSVSSTASASSASVVAGRSSLSLHGEPGTRVWVDGASRGACPTRVGIEPGSHEVRFTFGPTSETIVERVTVKAGEHVTVRAQFTGATPTVKVQR